MDMVLQNATIGFNVRARQKPGAQDEGQPPQVPARGRYVLANATRYLFWGLAVIFLRLIIGCLSNIVY